VRTGAELFTSVCATLSTTSSAALTPPGGGIQ